MQTLINQKAIEAPGAKKPVKQQENKGVFNPAESWAYSRAQDSINRFKSVCFILGIH
jgi:hypothetical protein